MSQPFDTILNEALSLPDSQREQLVNALIATLPDSDAQAIEQSWRDEVARRSAEYDAGLVQGIPWNEVKSNARAQLKSDA